MSIILFKKYFKKYWVLENQTSFSKVVLPMIPDGSLELFFVVGNGFTLKTASSKDFFGSGIYLGGQVSGLVELTLKSHTCIHVLKLQATTIPMISKLQISEITDKIIPLKAINKELYATLIDSLFYNGGIKICTVKLLNYLDRKKKTSKDSEFIRLCAWHFQYAEEDFTVLKKRILQDANVSAKTLENKFNRYIGLTPQLYFNTIKLRKSIELISLHTYEGNLTELAFDNGYYDQSHFIREFKALFKKSPTQLDFSNYFIPDSKDSFRYYTIQ